MSACGTAASFPEGWYLFSAQICYDQGSKFDASGNFTNWWTQADRDEFDKRTTCIADEYSSFVANRKSEALQDRIIMIRVPYNLKVTQEERIYDKLLKQSEALRSIHIAPNTLKVAAMFAVMTRLEEPKKNNIDIVKKMKLYDGEDVEGFKSKDVRELQEDTVREGMDGISPRYIINRLSGALVRDNITCINPIDALRAIKDGFEQHTGISGEQRDRYLNLIAVARREYDGRRR